MALESYTCSLLNKKQWGVKVQARVKLPSGPLVEFLTLTRAIAEAVCPTGEHGLTGIECVTGKLVPGHYPIPDTTQWGSMPFEVAYQSELVSDDGRPLDQLRTSEARSDSSGLGQLSLGASAPVPVHRFSYPFKLTDSDRVELLAALELLPPLRYPMSDEERDAFMEAYCNLPNKPMWLPTLVTDETVNRLKGAQHDVLIKHQRALREAHEAGQIASVNEYHVPLTGMMAGTYIPREHVVAYLAQHGLGCADVAAGEEKSASTCVSEENPQSISQVSGVVEAKVIGASHIKLDDRAEAVALCRALKAGGATDFVKQVAQRYGVDVRTVRNWVKKADEDEAMRRRSHSPFGSISPRK